MNEIFCMRAFRASPTNKNYSTKIIFYKECSLMFMQLLQDRKNIYLCLEVFSRLITCNINFVYNYIFTKSRDNEI